ncbi:ABC transporter substrate-binding protein [Pseudactinotalea sp.]|uniref:ABC transporter substrate-binding protein n=1 Tax=Pseudactinotalea sp. TaxID=1926260 RepID=UPI003B3AAC8F
MPQTPRPQFLTPNLSRRRLLQMSAASGVTAALAACSTASGDGGSGQARTTITVANVANPVTEDLAELTRSEFAALHPDVDVRFSSLPETELRERVSRDVATGGGQFDVLALGPYETSQYSAEGWLADLRPMMDETPEYDREDLIPAVLETLSTGDQVWAAPVYAESAMLMYRTDILDEHGITMPQKPTWQDVAQIARDLHTDDVAGIAGSGLPGESQVPLMAMIYAFGGRIFTPDWEPTFVEPETYEAIEFYVDLMQTVTQPGVASAGFNQTLSAFTQGQTAMFMGATVAGNTIEDSSQSSVAGKVGYAAAPHYRSPFGGWYWSWALAIPESSTKKEAAWKFISWATSKEYMQLAGETYGWHAVPPGTRTSTYAITDYRDAAPFADITLEQLEMVSSDVLSKPTAPPQLPAAYFEFPQWTDVYMPMTQELASAITGQKSVRDAVDAMQQTTEETMRRAGLWTG